MTDPKVDTSLVPDKILSCVFITLYISRLQSRQSLFSRATNLHAPLCRRGVWGGEMGRDYCGNLKSDFKFPQIFDDEKRYLRVGILRRKPVGAHQRRKPLGGIQRQNPAVDSQDGRHLTFRGRGGYLRLGVRVMRGMSISSMEMPPCWNVPV